MKLNKGIGTKAIVFLLALVLLFVTVLPAAMPTAFVLAEEAFGNAAFGERADEGTAASADIPYQASQQEISSETLAGWEAEQASDLGGSAEYVAPESYSSEYGAAETGVEGYDAAGYSEEESGAAGTGTGESGAAEPVSAEQPKELKTTIKSADNEKSYTVKVFYDPTAEIPEDASLSVLEILPKPEAPKDKTSAEYKAFLERPKQWERFVTAKELAEMQTDLKDALGLVDEKTKELKETLKEFYSEYLEIKILSGEKEVEPKAPVRVVVETDEVVVPVVTEEELAADRELVKQVVYAGVFDPKADKAKKEKVYKDLWAANISNQKEEGETETPTEQKLTRLSFVTKDLGTVGLFGVYEMTEEQLLAAKEKAAEQERAAAESETTSKETIAGEEATEAGADSKEELPAEEGSEKGDGQEGETKKLTSEEGIASQPQIVFEAEISAPGTYAAAAGKPIKNPEDEASTQERSGILKVTVEAEEGTFPEGTKMLVREVTQNRSVQNAVRNAFENGLTGMQAVDITFYDEAGNEIEPEKPVKVKFNSDFIRREKADTETVQKIVHLVDLETAVVMEQTDAGEASAEDELQIVADGFSVYVIVAHEGDQEIKNPRVEFHFLSQEYHEKDADVFSALADNEYEAGLYSFVNKGGTSQTSQVLKNGEALEMIANPPNIKIDGKDSYFFGWYVVTPSGTTPVNDGEVVYTWEDDPKEISFEQSMTIEGNDSPKVGDTVTWTINGVSGTAELDAEGTGHVYLAPIYEDYYFLNFHLGGRESSIWGTISKRKLLVLGKDGLTLVRIGDQTAPSTDATRQVFAGWETVNTVQKQVIQNGVSVMIDAPDSTKRIFPSVDPVTGEEQTDTVYASDGSSYTPAESSGYYIVVQEEDLTDNSLDLYPVFAEARWLRFDTGKSGNGSTYVPSQYLLTSDRVQGEEGEYNSPYYVEKLPAGEQPQRNGYQFKGWYANALRDENGEILNIDTPMEVTFKHMDGDVEVDFTEEIQAIRITDENGNFVTGDFQKKITDGGVEKLLYEIKDGKLYVYENMESLTLSALWEEVPDTTYSVLVWKQKVTDDVYATDAEKTYDYSAEDSATKANGRTGRTLQQVLDSGELNDYVKTNANGKYEGFTLRGGNAASGVTMSTSTVKGDGTTVINVYYDRNIHTLTFQTGNGKNSNNNPNEATGYSYTVSTGNETPQYAFIPGENGGEIVELVREDDAWKIPAYGYHYVEDDENGTYGKIGDDYYPLQPITEDEYSYSTQYTYSENNDNNGKRYGIVDGEYVQLVSETKYLLEPYCTTNSQGQGTVGNNNTYYYGVVSGEYQRVYYVNSKWRTENLWYSPAYNGTVYKLIEEYDYLYGGTYTEYTGTERGSYYVLEDGDYVLKDLTYYSGYGWYSSPNKYDSVYILTGAVYYNGPRYARSNGAFYAGVRLLRSGDNVPYSYSVTVEDGTELYMQDANTGADGSFGHVKLNATVNRTPTGEYYFVDSNGNNSVYTGEHRYSYVYGKTGMVEYNGDRYSRSGNMTSAAHTVFVIKALYGQSLAHYFPIPDFINGERWMPVGDSVWTEVLAYIDSMPNRDVSFVLDISKNSTKNLYYYVEALPGVTATRTYNGKGFVEYTKVSANYGFFTEAEDYITIEGFSKNNSYPPEAYSSNGSTANKVWGSGSNATEIYCYYLRDNEKLIFNDNYPNAADLSFVESGGPSNGHEETIPYQGSLVGYDSKYTPNAPDHYTFMGWFENAGWLYDEKTAVPFDFNSFMPSGDKVVYAKWKPESFRVQIDPNGGVIDHIDHRGVIDYSRLYGITIFNGTNGRLGNQYLKDQSTYFNGNYNEMVGYYGMDGKRQYVEITDAEANSLGTGNWYYYLNTQYRASDGTGLPSDLRNALYITEAEVDEYYEYYRSAVEWNRLNLPERFVGMEPALTKNVWMDIYLKKNANGSFQKFRPVHGTETYTFLGWYKILYEKDEDGNLVKDENGNCIEIGPEAMPYNFSDPLKEPITLRAYWRLDGGYRIQYTPNFTMPDGTEINGEMEAWLDPQISTSTYADSASTNVYRQPTGLTANGSAEDGEDYIFRGWRLVSMKTVNGNPVYTPLEDNVYYDPGEPFTVRAGYADENSFIHFQAVYEKKSESYRRPEVTALKLNANSGFLTSDGTDPTEGYELLDWSNGGKISLDYSTEEMTFGYYEENPNHHYQTGNVVHLYQYATDLTENSAGETLDPPGKNYFKHPNDYVLLGFDEAADENDFVATYSADAVISTQRKDDKTLYAVWEPLVYLNIVNATKDEEAGSEGGPLTINLTSADDSALYVVNQKTGVYDRVPISDVGNITLEEGETLRLAVPYGKDHPVTVSGTNHLGTGILLYWQGDLNGETEGHCNGETKNGEDFSATETLVEDKDGVTITFRSLKADYTLVQDDNWSGGYKSEAYFSNIAADANFVQNSYMLPSPSTRLGYEFLGWAKTKANADNGVADYPVPTEGNPNSMTIPNMKTQIFDPLDAADGNEDRIVTVYAVWKAKADASTVYIYKDVQDAPESVRQNKEFTFTLKSEATFKKKNQSSEKKEYQQSYPLKDDQYLKVYTSFDAGEANQKAVLKTTVERYQINTNGEDQLLYTYEPLQSEWTNSSNGSGDLTSFSMTVSEMDYSAQPHYFDTDLELAASTETPLEKDSVRQVSWNSHFTGGTVIFTNTRQTVDVDVKKVLEGRNIAAGFTFGVAYTADGETTTRGDISVTSGSATGTVIEKVPVGASLTITEKGTELADYETSAKQDETPLTVTADSETVEGVTTYFRAVTVDVTKATTITYKNVLKSVPVKIVKLGFDGTNTYTDVEAQFTMSQGTSNVFTGRYSRPVNSSTPRGNIIFETGEIYSGQVEDPKLYVGEYSLHETRLWGDYMSLDENIKIHVAGTESGAEVTVDGKSASVQKVGDVWEITVINRKTADISVQAGLLDPMITQRSFSFAGSYVLDGENHSIAPFDLTVYSTSDGSVDAAHEPKTLSIPIGATDLSIWEDTSKPTAGTDTIATTYTTTVERNDEGKNENSVYRYGTAFSTANTGDVITFTNSKKTIDITVKKNVKAEETSGSFAFTAVLLNGSTPIKGYPIFTGTNPLDDNDDEFTDVSTGAYSFTLENYQPARDNSCVLSVPVGAKLTIKETGVDGNESGYVIDDFTAKVSTVLTENEETYAGNTVWNGDAKQYTLSAAPSTPLTVTISNELNAICKVVDKNRVEHPFLKLNAALNYIRTHAGDVYIENGESAAAAIEMLVDYEIPQSDKVTLNQANDNIIITTAATSGGVYNFVPTFTAEQGRRTADSAEIAILKRGWDGGGNADQALFYIGGDKVSPSLTTQNILFDGEDSNVNEENGEFIQHTGRALYVNTGSLTVTDGSTFRNFLTPSTGQKGGGAIFSAQVKNTKIQGSEPSAILFENCRATGGTSDYDGGGAIAFVQGTTDAGRVEGATFIDCSSIAAGGAIHVRTTSGAKTFLVTNCVFDGHKNLAAETVNAKWGGAIYIWDGWFSLTDCDFTDCTATEDGGSVSVHNGQEDKVELIENCSFNGHDTLPDTIVNAKSGGAIGFTNVAKGVDVLRNITVTNYWINDGNGGGINAPCEVREIDGLFDISNCYTTKGDGGGIYFSTVKNLTDDVRFKIDNCHASSKGGGICFANAFGKNVTIKNSAFTDCYAGVDGGSVWAKNTGSTYTTKFESCVFNGHDDDLAATTPNAANGGGIYIYDGHLEVVDCILTNLTAKTNGGAIYMGGGGGDALTLTSCTIDGNDGKLTQGGVTVKNATEGGGIWINADAGTKLNDVTIKNCQASGNGGGIYDSDPFTETTGTVLFENCYTTGGNGGGAYFYSTAGFGQDGTTRNTVTFKDCYAGGNGKNGGGAFFNSTVTVRNGVNVQFDSCYTGTNGNGGGAYFNGTTTLQTNSQLNFESCHANQGGGAWFYPSTTLSNAPITFKDCYAAKRGGGAYFVNSATLNNTVSFTNCHTDTAGTSDGGGGVWFNNSATLNTNANLEFKDCYTASNAGGAWFQGTATVNASAGLGFEDCHAAMNAGGAYFAGAATVNANADLSFDDCYAGKNGGGAYFAGNYAHTLSGVPFTNCKAGWTWDDNAQGFVSVAGGNGGGIYKAQNALTLTDATFTGCYASANGGAIYYAPGSTFTLNSGTSITGCTVADGGRGSAIYINSNGAVTFNGGTTDGVNGVTITGNRGGGAVEVNNNSAVLTFAGNVLLYDNFANLTSGEGITDVQKNMVLDRNTNTVIKTAKTGLGADAHIGVYVTDTEWDRHGKIHMPFGTWQTTDVNLEKFTNDRDEELFGVMHPDDSLIYWGRIICKIMDTNGKEHVFATLNRAVKYARVNSATAYVDGICTVQMLADYVILKFDVVTLDKATDNFLFTTAATEANKTPSEEYFFTPTFTSAEGRTTVYDDDGNYVSGDSAEKAILQRGWNGNATKEQSLFYVNQSAAKLAMADIILDGKSPNASGTLTQYTGRAIYANAGSTEIKGGTTFRNFSTADSGGAVYAQSITVKGSAANKVCFDNCKTTGSGKSGGAIYAAGSVNVSHANFTTCATTGTGGAIFLNGTGTASISDATAFHDCSSGTNGGAIYSKSTSLTLDGVTINGHTEGGLAASAANAQLGGAIYAEGNVTIKNGEIKNCSASNAANGGAVNLASGKTVSFEGDAIVYGNTGTGTLAAQQKNVVLQNPVSNDYNRTINTTTAGLGENAHIGVYVTGTMTGTQTEPYKNHGQFEQNFGTWPSGGSTEHFDAFTNDRNGLYGENSSTAQKIRWTSYLCKLTDNEGKLLYTDNEHNSAAVYKTFSAAFNALKGLSESGTGEVKLYKYDGTEYEYTAANAINVELLKNYRQPGSDAAENTAKRSVTMKTAANTQSGNKSADDIYIYNKGNDAGVNPNYATVKRGFTGVSMFIQNAASTDASENPVRYDLSLTGIILDGNKDVEDPVSTADPKAKYTATTNGGIVKVDSGTLNIGTNATLRNSTTAANGGAVYVDAGAKMIMNTGTITGNTATNGAGVYLAEGTALELSGAPNFGGTAATGANINMVGTGTSAKRQDIFIAGYLGKDASDNPKLAESLIMTGALNLDKGSIWVGAEVQENQDNNHWDGLKQFAKFAEALMVTDASGNPKVNLTEEELTKVYEAFRNAITTEEYYGTTGENIQCIYWDGVRGSRKVILRKTDGSYQTLQGATFEIRKGSPSGALVQGTDANGNPQSLFTSLESGVFFVGELDYGTYYVKETVAPSGHTLPGEGKYFIITVDADGVGYQTTDANNQKTYSNSVNATEN